MKNELSKKDSQALVKGDLRNWQGRKEWFFNRDYTDTYELYYEGPYKRAEQEQKKVMKELVTADSRIKELLEYGCGTTRFTRWWSSIGIDATGTDISPFMLSQAIHLFGGNLAMGDSHFMPYKDNTFDAVAFMNTFEYYQNPEKVLQEAARVARYGIAMGMMNKITPKFIRRRVQQSIGRNEFYRTATFYTPKTLQALIKKSLPDRKYKIHWKMTGLPSWFPVREWKRSYGDFFGMYIEFLDYE
uniref:class I SAM-dependent methyltransferase n=1 Tax=Ornithobacterium rhinotracheale TaxID=28251 RepID=UPI0039A71F87